MKIKGTVEDVQANTSKVTNSSRKAQDNAALLKLKSQTSASDSVDLTISKAISEQLDPTKMAAERRAKIENLKKAIASGEYKPSAEAVAQAVSDEISMDILTTDTVEGV